MGLVTVPMRKLRLFLFNDTLARLLVITMALSLDDLLDKSSSSSSFDPDLYTIFFANHFGIQTVDMINAAITVMITSQPGNNMPLLKTVFVSYNHHLMRSAHSLNLPKFFISRSSYSMRRHNNSNFVVIYIVVSIRRLLSAYCKNLRHGYQI